MIVSTGKDTGHLKLRFPMQTGLATHILIKLFSVNYRVRCILIT